MGDQTETTIAASDTFERVQRVVHHAVGGNIDDITLAATMTSLGADALDAVVIAMEIEDEFDMVIGDDEIDILETVGDIVKLIDGRTR